MWPPDVLNNIVRYMICSELQAISQNEELRVWYAEHYAEALGETVMKENVATEEPLSPPKQSKGTMGKSLWTCKPQVSN